MKHIMKKAGILLLSLSLLLSGEAFGTTAKGMEREQNKSFYKQWTNNQEVETAYDSISNYRIAAYGTTAVTLSWFSQGNNDGYTVYRKSKYDKGYQKIGTVKNNVYETLTFKDTKFKWGIAFTYKLVTYRTDENGKNQEGLSASLTAKKDLPKVNISSAKRKGTNVTLQWKKAQGADGYEIYRKNSGGSYKKVKTVKAGSSLSYTAKKVTTKKDTKIKIRAYVKYNGNFVQGSFGAVKYIYGKSKQKLITKFKKLQKRFPSGKYWNHVGKSKYNSNTITNKPCSHFSRGLKDCNSYSCPNGVIGFQCYGFAWKMSDLIYGKKAKIKNFSSFKKCKAGDVIRYSGHSVIVTKKTKNYVEVGECNVGGTCIISWGRRVYKNELLGAVYSRRY